MKIKNLTIFILITIFYNSAYAQLDDTLKAKLYIDEAQKLFSKGDFNASLSYVEKTENTLGKKVSNTMALKIKIAYKLSNFSLAKELFDDYTKNYMKEASKELNDEVLAMFIDIEEAVEAEIKRKEAVSEAKRQGKLLINLKGLYFEVYPRDLGVMEWQDAIVACNRLGAGWRLPTKDELEQMYLQLHKNGKGNFKSSPYWSSTEEEDDALALKIYFFDGSAQSILKFFTGYVRAVRSL